MKENIDIENTDSEFPVIKERSRWLFLGLPFTFKKYELSRKRLTFRKGFLNISEEDLLLYRIMDITVKRGIIQRMTGLGTIIIVSSDQTNPTLVIKNIKHTGDFKNSLNDRVEKERMRMRFRTGELMDNDSDESELN